jgi:hypothetical protein
MRKRSRFHAVHAGLALLGVFAALAYFQAPFAVGGLISAAVLTFVLILRRASARRPARDYSTDSTSSSTTDFTQHNTSWFHDVFWLSTAATIAHDAASGSSDDSSHKHTDSSDSSGGLFGSLFGGDSSSSDSGSSDSSSSGSDYSGSDSGSSDSGSSGGSWD